MKTLYFLVVGVLGPLGFFLVMTPKLTTGSVLPSLGYLLGWALIAFYGGRLIRTKPAVCPRPAENYQES
ncbi:MAG: hypothetical protein WC675_00115 [Patescibacteria group bacterium]|jgi:hypothetical protein